MPGSDDVVDASPLTAGAAARVRQDWADRLHVPVDAWLRPGTHLVPRDDATAVVVVQLGGSRVVVLPPGAVAPVESVDEGLVMDLPTLVARLERFSPRPIGTAALSYRDTPPPRRIGGRVGVAGPAAVTSVGSACSADEWAESGLTGMTHRYAAFAADDHPVAIAGYERWGGHLAQLGVAADPAHRGRGHAAAAAGEAVTAAVAAGLVAQWRCRVGNTASERLGRRLGFQQLGSQVAVLVETASGCTGRR